MSEDVTVRNESGLGVRAQLDPPLTSLPSGSMRTSRVRPTLTSVPSGIIVHDFQEPGDQQEVYIYCEYEKNNKSDSLRE